MNKIKFLLPLIVICIALGGCPYQSNVPIDNPTVKINPDLLGKWEADSSSGDRYVVSKLDDYHYKIEEKEKGMELESKK